MRLSSAAQWTGLWMTAAALVASAGIAGCGRSDEPAASIRTVSDKMGFADVRGVAPAPSTKHVRDIYGESTGLLKPTASGLPAEAAAGSLMSARAQAGLAELAAEDAGAIERQTLLILGTIREAHDQWLANQSRAAALQAYDPSQEIAGLDDQIKQKVEDSAKAKEQKQQIDAALAGLDHDAGALLDRARTERDAEAKLRQQAVSVTATRRAELLTQANQHRRAADGFDKEASLLKAQQASRAPEGADIQARIDELTAQATLLADSKAQLQAMTKANQDKAKDAQDKAKDVAQRIKAAVAELTKARAGVADATDKAVHGYAQAAAAAKAAAQACDDADVRCQSKLESAFYAHGQADILASRARGIEAVQAAMQALAGSKPALPDSAEYSKLADEANKQLDASLDAAKKAYETAKSEYAAAAGCSRQDVKDRLAKLNDTLTNIAERKIGTPAWLDRSSAAAKPAAPAPAPSASAAPGGDSEAEVRQAVESLLSAAKAGDADRIFGMITSSSPEVSKFFGSVSKALASFKTLDAACKDKFGSSLQDAMKQSGSGMAGMTEQFKSMGGALGAGDLANATAADFDIKITGPGKATATPKGGGEAIPLVKSGGAWKVEVPAEQATAVVMLTPMADAVGKTFDDLNRDLKAGKFADMDALMKAFETRLTAALGPMGAMLGGGGKK